MPGVASAATAILIAHVAGGTRSIRVGSGGIMLPNHAPLIVAEQFGTLETLYPGASTSELARAPGTGQAHLPCVATGFGNQRRSISEDVARTATFLRRLRIWGRLSGDSRARLKVHFLSWDPSVVRGISGSHAGLPFAFASHFAPGALKPRSTFTALASAFPPLERPYVMGRRQ